MPNKPNQIVKINEKYGFLTIIGNSYKTYDKNNINTERKVLCQCDCGKEKIIRERSILKGLSKSCGCRGKSIKIGQKFGRWTILSEPYFILKNEKKKKVVDVLCNCGTSKTISTCAIGIDSKSCGCYKKEKEHSNNFKHGFSNENLYRRWSNMKQRCLNHKNKEYKWYGGKGIKIFNKWLDYINFRNWSIKNGYNKSLSLDRINPEKNYEPSNCQWITKSENSKKRNSFYPNKIKELQKQNNKLNNLVRILSLIIKNKLL